MSPKKLNSLFTIYTNDHAVSHIFLSLCQYMQDSNLQVRMVVPNCAPSLRAPNMVEAIPLLLKTFYYRSTDASRNMTEKRFLKDMNDFDAAYLWPTASLEAYKRVKKLDKPIFMERFNCYQGKSKCILDEAYTRLGVHPQRPITPEGIVREKAKTELADFIFCPSLEVKKSFQEAGVPEDKLILTSYGWSPQRFPNISSNKPQQDRDAVTVLFVGTIDVRKGANLLLRAWERSGVKGKLMLCGKMEPVIAETCASLLNRSDVIHVDYNRDLSSTYSQADFFAFPSLEEGSPLVIYEAMAHGLPILTSPMGGGGVVRDGIDGTILPPYDEDAWVEALRKFADSPELRAQFGASARELAQEFTWEKVARRRAAVVLEKLN